MGRKAVSKDSKGVTQLGGTGTAFNLNMPQAGGALEFKASLVYKVSSRPVRTKQRNPVFRKQTNKQKQKKMPLTQRL